MCNGMNRIKNRMCFAAKSETFAEQCAIKEDLGKLGLYLPYMNQ